MADVGIHIIEDMSTNEANPSNINVAPDDEIHETSTEQVPNEGSRPHSDRSLRRKAKPVIIKIFIVLVFLIGTPVIVVTLPFLISIIAEIVMSKIGRPKTGIYEKVFSFESLGNKIRRLSIVGIARLGCLALIWLVITVQVSSIKNQTILGSTLLKWSLSAAVIFYGYPSALFAFGLATTMARVAFDPFETHDKAYFWMGFYRNLTFLLYSTSVLIVWLVYFHAEHTLNKYMTWTLASFLVGAILGLVKSVVVLHWRAKAIYRRFKPRILMAGFQLYFLCIVVSEYATLSLMPWRYQRLLNTQSPDLIKDEKQPHKTADNKRRSIQDYFVSKHMGLLQLAGIADRLAGLAEVLRENDGVAEVEEKCRVKISNKGGEQHITKEYIVGLFEELYEDVEEKKDKLLKKLFRIGSHGKPKKKTSGDDISEELMNDGANLLLEEVKAQQSSNTITHEMLRKWMVDAHKDCLSLGYTLVDAMAVVNVLDWVLTCSIVAVVILFWLTATGLATTAVLVTIVSPFLALTFMFGDTFKAFFQGVIFSFATHPFDVGDECSIDSEELVVKNINILTTTFYGNKNKDIVLLPNSNLATKRIVVHKSGTRMGTKDASTQADDSPRYESSIPVVASLN